MSTHEIVIIGGNMGAIPMAHHLLKHTIPQLEALNASRKYHITMISPNTSYYWKIAGSRALVSYEQTTQEKLFYPITEAFKSYPGNSFAHVAGKAIHVDGASKTVSVKLNEGSERKIVYNSLILATGVHYESPLWTTEYGTQATIDAQLALQTSLKSARSALIAGGGAVGVETAGEVSATYPGLNITLISGTNSLLSRVPAKIGAEAERQLRAANVDVVHNKRVTSTTNIGKQTVVAFDDGTDITVDIYINAFAGRPIIDYLPTSWTESGHVKVNKDTLRASGPDSDGVYAIGDMHIHSGKQAMEVKDSLEVIGSALAIDVLEGLSVDEKAQMTAASGNRGLLGWLLGLFGSGSGAKMPKQKNFKTMAMMAVPIGKSGTGSMMGYKMPGWFVYMMKGKTLMVQWAPAQVDGSAW